MDRVRRDDPYGVDGEPGLNPLAAALEEEGAGALRRDRRAGDRLGGGAHPTAEIKAKWATPMPGLQARLMSQALRKLAASVNKCHTVIIFINQIRMKIGVMYGTPETTTGGNALKFYASVRLDIRRIGAIKERDEVVGNQTRVKVVKNKLAPPFKQVEFDTSASENPSEARASGTRSCGRTAAQRGSARRSQDQARARL